MMERGKKKVFNLVGGRMGGNSDEDERETGEDVCSGTRTASC